MNRPARVLIAGCGDLGTRLGLLLSGDGHDVTGLRRSAGQLPAAIRGLSADLTDSASLRGLAARIASTTADLDPPYSGRDVRAEYWDTVIFAAAASQRSEAGYRAIYVDGMQRLLDALQPAPRVLFVSSTAVYGQDDGSWVDEDSPTEPRRFNGALLLEAEQRLRERLPQAIVVRPSGLYGPGRTRLIERARRGDAAEPRWTNRIRIEDAAAAIHHILRLPLAATTWLLNDDQPALESEVLNGIRERLGLAPVHPFPESAAGRRVSNARLRRSGFACRFAGFREGYADLLG